MGLWGQMAGAGRSRPSMNGRSNQIRNTRQARYQNWNKKSEQGEEEGFALRKKGPEKKRGTLSGLGRGGEGKLPQNQGGLSVLLNISIGAIA